MDTADITREPSNTSPPTEDVLDRLIRQVQAESPPTADVPLPTSAPQNSASSGGLLGGLLSNPALLQALPALMGQVGKGSPQGEGNPPSPSPAKASVSVDRHTALLCAIKPYLGHDRQQAAEYMIRMCRIFSTLQSMGISLPTLLTSMAGGGEQTFTQDKEV